MTLKAWHFTEGATLRDGRPVEVGEWLAHEGEVRICHSGLHASVRPLDALRYAPGNHIWRVECADIEATEDDKLVCRLRRPIWGFDAGAMLHRFARKCAMDVAHLWNPPDVVLRYLRTGDESIRAAAGDAARDAARGAARAAARAAARGAARAVARAAAWDAARAAAWDAARAAARGAARGAARAAARGAARAAARAASIKQNRRLSAMLSMEARHRKC